MKLEDIKKMTTEDLIKEYQSLYDAVYNVDCFSCKDLQLFYMIENELMNRECTFSFKVEIKEPED